MKIFQRNLLVKFLFLAILAFAPSAAFAQASLTIEIAPPPLPVYEQPPCPDDGYLWAPGYWAYDDDGYYWVPGTWVQPPEPDVYWTPGYWAWNGSNYAFNDGYWGPNVGYYGGINYGYGYGGSGYGGGRWENGRFAYNTAVTRVNVDSVHNRYEDRSAIRSHSARVSYNGGPRGVQAKPTAQEQQFSSERHVAATSVQQSHVQAASHDPGQFAKANGGKPATTVAARPEAYQSIAQKRASSQPRTEPDQPQVNAVKSSTGIAPSPQVNPDRPTPSRESTPAAESRDRVVEPHNSPAAIRPPAEPMVKPTPQLQPDAKPMVRQESEVKPPSHVEPEAKTAPHSAPEAKSMPHAQPQAKPAPHPEAGAQPQGNRAPN